MRLQYILFCIGTLLWSSCYDDLGNYDYHSINEIKVVGGIEERYSAYTMVDTLKISPILSFTEDSTSAERFEYSWFIAKANFGSGKLDKISDQKDLVYPVNLPNETYVVLFKVKDKVSEVEWSAQTSLYVTTLFTNGWMMLGERDGNVSLDMVSISTVGDTMVLTDILKNSGLPVLKGPRKMISINRYYNSSSPWTTGCFLMTDDGTYELDRVSMTSGTTANILKYMYDPEVSPDFAGSDMLQNMGYYRYMIGDNTLYVNGSLMSSGAYGNPINKYGKYDTEYFKVYPEIIWGVNSWGSFSGKQMVYDMDHKRFVQFNQSSINCDTLPDNNGDVFEWKTGNEMIAVFNSKFVSSGTYTSYAIMKSPGSRWYIYSFQPASSTGPKKGGKFDITDLPDISQATQFAFSGKYPYMLYVAGSKLHACEFLTTGVMHKEFDEFGGDEITMLHFDTYREGGADVFYVATYHEQNGGTVRKYRLKDDPNDIGIERIEEVNWTGLGKVTSMCWKWY
ncbi:MAG: hypothetical protein K2L23_09680 [Odoribacter sp.]|nr:hypothetical protein [Odoribacter sp.]